MVKTSSGGICARYGVAAFSAWTATADQPHQIGVALDPTFQEECVHSFSSATVDVCPTVGHPTRDYGVRRAVAPQRGRHVCTLRQGCMPTAWIKASPMGEGLELILSFHRAFMPTERLLDVRHRTIRLPLDRKRHQAASAAPARCQRRSTPDRVARGAIQAQRTPCRIRENQSRRRAIPPVGPRLA